MESKRLRLNRGDDVLLTLRGVGNGLVELGLPSPGVRFCTPHPTAVVFERQHLAALLEVDVAGEPLALPIFFDDFSELPKCHHLDFDPLFSLQDEDQVSTDGVVDGIVVDRLGRELVPIHGGDMPLRAQLLQCLGPRSLRSGEVDGMTFSHLLSHEALPSAPYRCFKFLWDVVFPKRKRQATHNEQPRLVYNKISNLSSELRTWEIVE